MTTDSTRALVAQMRDTLLTIRAAVYGSGGCAAGQYDRMRMDAREVIAAADQWLASPPTNQCGETCERAKLCAICARGLEPQESAGLCSCGNRPATECPGEWDNGVLGACGDCDGSCKAIGGPLSGCAQRK